MKATVLIDNISHEELKGEWGLSILIEYNDKKILLDGGTSGRFIDNAGKLGIDLNDIDSDSHFSPSRASLRLLLVSFIPFKYFSHTLACSCSIAFCINPTLFSNAFTSSFLNLFLASFPLIVISNFSVSTLFIISAKFNISCKDAGKEEGGKSKDPYKGV